ncbi:MAG TPA: hypothetical protein VFW57_11045 [Acidimicrobiia bacterium]|nr:hypothetical protein [Acidimicrobiia bacterium]
MVNDRLLGVLCLGVATLAATWGGNDVLHQAAAHAARSEPPGAHADAVISGLTSTDTTPSPATSATTAAASSSTTTAQAAPLAAPSPSGEEDPAALARRAVLAQTDLPAGFTMTAPAPTDPPTPGESPFERCAGSDGASLTSTIGGRARSATFAKPDVGSASSAAVVFDQPATAEKVLGLMTTPAARSCFEQLVNTRLARNANLSQDVKGSLGPAPSPSVGEGSVAYRFDVRLPAEDIDRNAKPSDPPIRFVSDFVFIRKGRTLVLAEFGNLRQPWVEAALKGVATSLVAHA